MRKDTARRTCFRSAQFESLESRTMMTASAAVDDPPDFVLDHFVGSNQPTSAAQASPFSFSRIPNSFAKINTFGQHAPLQNSLSRAHGQTGLTTARNTYGLTGIGQTVAVIDSGLAWNHQALGGGFGANYRVVGGWDFTENDADPYDDGTAGSHGTHVAGIIGSDNLTNTGVAPGVDLVALRVFNDSGAGYFHWVESALRWVHQNRNSFEHAITTVNLSIGSVWNSSSVPLWAQLEDEFAQLEADGIFIAVAAGNSFTSYNTPGLSYPGASSYVVPVAALDYNATALAGFSQRLNRVIAAPGTSITSSVPDYAGNGNGQADDFASYSGTSMASPYVAGSAVLIRQAMQFAGQTNITQDRIYDVMVNTADVVWDPITQQNYRRLNLQQAIASVMPADDYGSTVGAAHALGTVAIASTFSGAIGTVSDRDYFTFTAGTTGNLTFTAATTDNLAARWEVVGGGGAVSTVDGNDLTLNVTAGQTYTFAVCTTNGIGRYSVTANTGIGSVQLGAVDFSQLNNQAVNAEQWYSFTAARSGVLTAEALYASVDGNVDLRLYNSASQLIGSSAVAGNERVDVNVVAGQQYHVQIVGSNNDVDVRLTNLVGRSGTTLSIWGTAAADTFSFTAGTTESIVINGVAYDYAAAAIATFNFNGLAGVDTVVINGSTAFDHVTLKPTSTIVVSAGYRVTIANAENTTVNSGGGGDYAEIYDSTGNDVFFANPVQATMAGTGYSNAANGFAHLEVVGSTGYDVATLHDSSGNDTASGGLWSASLTGTGYFNRVWLFDATQTHAINGGFDVATLTDSAGNDTLVAGPTSARLYGSAFDHATEGFDQVFATANGGGWDIALLYDSAGDDAFWVLPKRAYLLGLNYYISAEGFEMNGAHGTTGNDKAYFYDSYTADWFDGYSKTAIMGGSGYVNYSYAFKEVAINASSGYDMIARRAALEYVYSQTGWWR